MRQAGLQGVTRTARRCWCVLRVVGGAPVFLNAICEVL
jgi:hypothetical protein